MRARRSHRETWLKRGVVAVLVYFAVVIMAGASTDSLLYQPKYGSFRAPTGGMRIKTADGLELSVVYLSNPAARFTLWYFHGNAEDLGDIEPRLRNLRDLGYAVFAVDYPGYGLSGGRPSEQGIYDSTRTALAYLREKHGVTPDKIVVYGRSMGGGPGVELAVKEPVAGLILESAFMSVYRVKTHWRLLPFDKFENIRKIPRVKCLVLVIHGRDDHVVPFYHGEALYDAVRGSKQFFWSDLAGHNDLLAIDGSKYWQSVIKFSVDIGAIAPPSGDRP